MYNPLSIILSDIPFYKEFRKRMILLYSFHELWYVQCTIYIIMKNLREAARLTRDRYSFYDIQGKLNKKLILLGSVQAQLYAHVNMFICKPLDLYYKDRSRVHLTIN